MATMNQQIAAALSQILASAGDPMNEATEVQYEGTAIVLPMGMSENEAIETLKRRRDENDAAVNVRELIPGYPLDALLALQRAMAKKYGWTGLIPTPGFFGPTPPSMISVVIDAKGNTASVPWGRMTIPGVKGHIEPGIEFDAKKQPQLLLGGVVQRRFLPVIRELASLAREEQRNASIYRGKAIRIEFPVFDRNNEFDPQIHVPQFLNLNGVKRSDLIFREEVSWAVDTCVFGPITNIERVRAMGTPFRRGILLEGEYGVGKTLMANVAAKLCEENGITFIYLGKTSDIANARQFASQYALAVIFAEDVDSIMSGDDRDEGVNTILNVIDGVEGKHDEVMVIFSTNHPERINNALLRPGRIDTKIVIMPPDAKAAEKLVRFYAKDTLPDYADLTETGKLLDGNIPAAIREVVERAKLAAMLITPAGQHVTITVKDLNLSAKSMEPHLARLRQKPVRPTTVVQEFGEAVGTALAKAQAEMRS
jgi:transitional endoplasmic reticulum ATPase